MKVDYQCVWDARPHFIPGVVDSHIAYRDGGFIRLEIELRYPDGEKFAQAYHPKLATLPGLRIGDKVLFTIKPARAYERQKADRQGRTQPDKMEADEVRLATVAEFEDAIKSFQGGRIEDALKQTHQAELNAQVAERDAREKETEYNNNLTQLNIKIRKIEEEVEQKVSDRIASEREKLDKDRDELAFKQQELDKHQADLQRQEAEIAPYKRAIPLLTEEHAQTTDLPLPENLAAIWPGLLCMSGLAFRPDVATAFLLSVVASVYSGSIVLLNGSVGVGKTSLVNQAAQALSSKPAVIIPVRPAWIDPSDLVGFFDPINNTFRPTPFTTAIRDTTGDQLSLICLDELNLAKVENYAADLLSCIEYSRLNGKKIEEDNDAGQLKLYSKDIEQQLWEEAKDIAELEDTATREELRRLRAIRALITRYSSQSPFPANAVLLGTLNSDETTYDLSPKMIDRSYVITFPPTSFEASPKETEHPKLQIAVTELVSRINEAMITPAKHWDTVLGWNKELQGLGIPLGHRVNRDYNVFRAAGSVLGLAEDDCVGYFLFCKILPRIFFFKEQSTADAGTSETRCERWLEKLKEDYSDYGPVHVIDSMIKMCKDDRIPAVRYWSKS